jgi:OFA family oxalate/formate antiporter-like MFS transporter
LEDYVNDNTSASSSIRAKRVLYLVFATATLLVLGLIYAWSIFASPIGASFESYKPFLTPVFQVSMFAFCVSALFGAQIIKRASARVAIIFAAALLGAGFLLTAYFSWLGIAAVFIFYGILAGSGCGIGYNAIISLVNPWFPDKIGLCSGIQMMGFGISSLVFGQLANAMFGVIGWQAVFTVVAAVGVVVMVALAFVVKPAPANIASQLGMTGAAVTTAQSATKNQGILTTRTFWLFSIWATLLLTGGLTMIGSAKQGALALGVEDGFAGLLVGLISTMNGIGRVVNGTLFDKIGLSPVMSFNAVVGLVTMIGTTIAILTRQPMLYVAAGILVALSYSSVPVMASAFTRQRYKAADFAKNLGIANCNIASAAAINIVISLFLKSADGDNGAVIYGILAAFAIVSFLAVFAFKASYKRDLDKIADELS